MCEVECRLACNARKSISKFRAVQAGLRCADLPYFTPKEVVIHNTPEDCWVSFLGIVRDLTPLVEQYEGTREIKPILAYAGKDISHWFDPRTGDIVHRIHPVTGVRVPYTPHGPVPDVLLQPPTTEWRPLDHKPWWFDPFYVVGYVTRAARIVRIMNVLAKTEVTIEVCSEDTLERILQRHLVRNSNAQSYTWKYEGRKLNMRLTLGQNGIPDPIPKLRAVSLPDNHFVPCLMLYYNDDLK
uniref:Cytochrome b5 domain-containing protein 1 n=1 Tax=Graphocephala atropunctata TaxID=36148 RepID=A0A1B6KHP1_9HEMI